MCAANAVFRAFLSNERYGVVEIEARRGDLRL